MPRSLGTLGFRGGAAPRRAANRSEFRPPGGRALAPPRHVACGVGAGPTPTRREAEVVARMAYGLRCRSAYALTVREECTRLAHKNYAMHSVRVCDRHTAPARVRAGCAVLTRAA